MRSVPLLEGFFVAVQSTKIIKAFENTTFQGPKEGLLGVIVRDPTRLKSGGFARGVSHFHGGWGVAVESITVSKPYENTAVQLPRRGCWG